LDHKQKELFVSKIIQSLAASVRGMKKRWPTTFFLKYLWWPITVHGTMEEAQRGWKQNVWSHEQISAFIRVVCIDNDVITKAYLSHSFTDLDAKELPHPANSKGNRKVQPGMTRANFWRTTRS
jgi:hypothetical protein